MVTTLKNHLIHLLMPRAFVKMKQEMESRSKRYGLTVKNYESISGDLQREIDKNHFSPYLRYEKQEAINASKHNA